MQTLKLLQHMPLETEKIDILEIVLIYQISGLLTHRESKFINTGIKHVFVNALRESIGKFLGNSVL